MKKLRVIVSDHALVRYMERVLGINVDGVRDQILTEERKTAFRAGATAVRIGGIDFCGRMSTDETGAKVCVVTTVKPSRGKT